MNKFKILSSSCPLRHMGIFPFISNQFVCFFKYFCAKKLLLLLHFHLVAFFSFALPFLYIRCCLENVCNVGLLGSLHPTTKFSSFAGCLCCWYWYWWWDWDWDWMSLLLLSLFLSPCWVNFALCFRYCWCFLTSDSERM